MGSGSSVGQSSGGGDFYSNLKQLNEETMSIFDFINPFQLGTSV